MEACAGGRVSGPGLSLAEGVRKRVCLYSVPSVPLPLRLCLMSKQDTQYMDLLGREAEMAPLLRISRQGSLGQSVCAYPTVFLCRRSRQKGLH